MMKKVKKEEERAEPKVKREKPPLYNLQFVMLGKTETPKDQLKDKILKLGAKVASKITNTIAVIISTPAKVEQMGSRMQVDIQTDKNSYFKVQVLEADKDNMYLVFLAWGRIGTTIEGNNRDSGGTVVKAVKLILFMLYY
ncbi:hypothetical protein quinque_004883 [Culex quinquefasciatus]